MWPKWGYTAVIAWGSRGEGVGDRGTEVHTGKEVQGVLWGGGGLKLALGDFLGENVWTLFQGLCKKEWTFLGGVLGHWIFLGGVQF